MLGAHLGNWLWHNLCHHLVEVLSPFLNKYIISNLIRALQDDVECEVLVTATW